MITTENRDLIGLLCLQVAQLNNLMPRNGLISMVDVLYTDGFINEHEKGVLLGFYFTTPIPLWDYDDKHSRYEWLMEKIRELMFQNEINKK